MQCGAVIYKTLKWMSYNHKCTDGFLSLKHQDTNVSSLKPSFPTWTTSLISKFLYFTIHQSHLASFKTKSSMQNIPSFWGTWTLGRCNTPKPVWAWFKYLDYTLLDIHVSHWLCCWARASLYFSRLTLPGVNWRSKLGTPKFHLALQNGYTLVNEYNVHTSADN